MNIFRGPVLKSQIVSKRDNSVLAHKPKEIVHVKLFSHYWDSVQSHIDIHEVSESTETVFQHISIKRSAKLTDLSTYVANYKNNSSITV